MTNETEKTTQKFKIGDKVIYRNKIKTIKEVRNHTTTFMYMLKENSINLYFERELKPYNEITETNNTIYNKETNTLKIESNNNYAVELVEGVKK